MFRFLFSLVFLAVSTVLLGQGQTVEGRINLMNSELSLSDIHVFTENSEHYAVSDANGKFKFKNVTPGDYTLFFTGIGFKTITKKIMVSNQPIILQVELLEDIIDLPMIEVNRQGGNGGMMGSLTAPGSSHYISSKELKEIQSTNPHDILSRIPGVQLQEEDGFGLRPNIGLRASGSERSSKITIMEDGVLAAPAPYAASSAYFFPTIARMSSVEIVKGSSQISNGPFTTGGVINFISTPIPTEFAGKVRLGAGSFGSRNLHANVGNKHGNFSYLLETFQYSADGFKDIDFSDAETGFSKKDYLVKMKWQSNADSKVYQSFELKAAESREHSDETYLGLAYDDFIATPYRRYAASQLDEMNTKHRQLNLKHTISLIENFFIQTTVYQNNFSRNWYKLDNVVNENGEKVSLSTLLNSSASFEEAYNIVSGRNTTGNQSIDLKANNRTYLSRGVQTKFMYKWGSHNLEAGLRYHYDEMDRFQWVDNYGMNQGKMQLINPGIEGSESNRIDAAYALASYIQYNYKIKNWEITAGLRNEQITLSRSDYGKEDTDRTGDNLAERENTVNVFIPGASIQYSLNKNNQLFAGVHRGFAPPSSAPNTEAEWSVNYEAGYRIQRNSLFGSIVAFYNDYSNLLGADFASSGGTGNGDLFNGGQAQAYGVEMAINYKQKLTNKIWMPIQAHYTFNNATFSNEFDSDFDPWMSVQSGDELPYIANHVCGITTGLKSQKIGLLFTGNYTSDMRIQAGQGVLADDEKVAGRFLLSGILTYNLNKQMDISLAAQNLLNQKYAVANRPAGWRPGAPRNISIAIEGRF